jgi:hypothetical protein
MKIPRQELGAPCFGFAKGDEEEVAAEPAPQADEANQEGLWTGTGTVLIGSGAINFFQRTARWQVDGGAIDSPEVKAMPAVARIECLAVTADHVQKDPAEERDGKKLSSGAECFFRHGFESQMRECGTQRRPEGNDGGRHGMFAKGDDGHQPEDDFRHEDRGRSDFDVAQRAEKCRRKDIAKRSQAEFPKNF